LTASGSFSSPKVWKVLPDIDINFDASHYAEAPRLDYTLNFPITGKYYIWVRGKCISAVCGNSASTHVGLDGVATSTSD